MVHAWRTRGADGRLPAPPHDVDGRTWHHPDETLFPITKFGVSSVVGDPNYKTAMPVYKDVLSDADIMAVLSWIKVQWPAAIRRNHDQMNAAAARASRQ
jgi:mono/diheme cytochrome c family protein